MNVGSVWRLEMITVAIWVQLHNLLIGVLVRVLAEIRGFYPSFCKLAQKCWWHIIHKDMFPPCSLALFVLYSPPLSVSLYYFTCFLISGFTQRFLFSCESDVYSLQIISSDFLVFISGFSQLYPCLTSCHYFWVWSDPKAKNKPLYYNTADKSS